MRLFSLNQKNPLSFIVCGNLISDNDFLHMKRCFDDNVLIFVQKGTLFINSNNKSYCVKENQFILLKASEEHFGFQKSEGELSYFWLHFKTDEKFDFLKEYQSAKTSDILDFSKDKTYVFPEYGDLFYSNKLHLLFRQLMDFSMEGDFYNKSVLDYLCSVIVMELSQDFLSQLNSAKKINPVVFELCSWIKQNFNRQFSINELSKINGYQTEYLSKLFKENMGMTILQYTNQIRIESAKKLLPNFSVKETAYSCGFEDEKYFMKVFKKSEGITPGEYKNAFFKKNINS